MGCGFAMFRNRGHVFPHGQHSMEQPRSDFSNMANVSSRKRLLAPRLAEMAKCVGVVDPSSSWASDVIVCDTVSGTSPYSFLVSKPRRSPHYIGCKASGSRWVYRVSVAQFRGQRRQGSEKAHLKPPVPSTPLPQALADQPETGAGAVE